MPTELDDHPPDRSFAVVCGWHALLVAMFAIWVLTWPDVVGTGGQLSFTSSRWVMAVILVAFLLAPGLSISFVIACGLVAVLRRRRRTTGLVSGTLASLAGLSTVAGALAVYSLTRR